MKESPFLSIVILVKDNGQTLAGVVSDIRRELGRFGRPYDIILVDDGSIDDSEIVGRRLASHASHIKYHRINGGGQFGNVVKSGLGLADGTWMLCATADGTLDPRDIKELLKHAQSYDLVSGCRTVRQATGYDKFLRWFRDLLLGWRFGHVPKDARCAMMLISREIVRQVSPHCDGTAIGYELMYRSIRAGFRVIEVPIWAREPIAPESLAECIRIVLALGRTSPPIRKIQSKRPKCLGRIRSYLRRQWCLVSDRPWEASLDISSRCDLQCISCGVWSEPVRNESDAAFWVGILDELCRLVVRRVLLIGAEPLMREDIGRVLRAISVRGMAVSIFTNGFRLSQRATELVETGLDRLVLSLDGPESGVHDGLRGSGGVFEVALEGMRRLRDEAMIKNVPVPEIVFHTTVSVANAYAIPQMFQFARDEKVALTLQAVCQIPKTVVDQSRYNGEKIASRQYMIADVDLLLSREQIAVLKRQIGRDSLTQYNLSSRVLLALKEDHLSLGTVPVIPCAHVHHTVSISPQGDVYPCGLLSGYHYESLSRQPIGDIWNGQRRKRFVRDLKRDSFPVCDYCCHYLNNLTPGQVLRVMVGLPLK